MYSTVRRYRTSVPCAYQYVPLGGAEIKSMVVRDYELSFCVRVQLNSRISYLVVTYDLQLPPARLQTAPLRRVWTSTLLMGLPQIQLFFQ